MYYTFFKQGDEWIAERTTYAFANGFLTEMAFHRDHNSVNMFVGIAPWDKTVATHLTICTTTPNNVLLTRLAETGSEEGLVATIRN